MKARKLFWIIACVCFFSFVAWQVYSASLLSNEQKDKMLWDSTRLSLKSPNVSDIETYPYLQLSETDKLEILSAIRSAEYSRSYNLSVASPGTPDYVITVHYLGEKIRAGWYSGDGLEISGIGSPRSIGVESESIGKILKELTKR